ncbi:MAG: hypothetical protein Alpg2KO_19260 [Alphaproteobacteria bacterium]
MANSFMNYKFLSLFGAIFWLCLVGLMTSVPQPAQAQAVGQLQCPSPVRIVMPHIRQQSMEWDWVALTQMLGVRQGRPMPAQCAIFVNYKSRQRDVGFCCQYPSRCPGWLPPDSFLPILEAFGIGKYQQLLVAEPQNIYNRLAAGLPVLAHVQHNPPRTQLIQDLPHYTVISGMAFTPRPTTGGRMICDPELLYHNTYFEAPQRVSFSELRPNVINFYVPPFPRVDADRTPDDPDMNDITP